MSSAKVTSKGQTTIPKDIRDRIGIKPGDRLNFTAEPDGAIRVVPIRADLRSLKGVLRRRGQRPVTLAEIDDAIETEASGA